MLLLCAERSLERSGGRQGRRRSDEARVRPHRPSFEARAAAKVVAPRALDATTSWPSLKSRPPREDHCPPREPHATRAPLSTGTKGGPKDARRIGSGHSLASPPIRIAPPTKRAALRESRPLLASSAKVAATRFRKEKIERQKKCHCRLQRMRILSATTHAAKGQRKPILPRQRSRITSAQKRKSWACRKDLHRENGTATTRSNGSAVDDTRFHLSATAQWLWSSADEREVASSIPGISSSVQARNSVPRFRRALKSSA